MHLREAWGQKKWSRRTSKRVWGSSATPIGPPASRSNPSQNGSPKASSSAPKVALGILRASFGHIPLSLSNSDRLTPSIQTILAQRNA